MKLNNLKQNLKNMLKTTSKTFFESLKGSTGKVDHKRLTVFAFVVMFFVTTIVILYKKNEIPNSGLVETVLITMTSVILGGMGLTKITTKNKDVKNEIE
jgi:hypothetical protein